MRERLVASMAGASIIILSILAAPVVSATAASTAWLAAAQSHVGAVNREMHVVGLVWGVATDPELGRAPSQALTPAATTSSHGPADRANVNRLRPQIQRVCQTRSPAGGATMLVEVRRHASGVFAAEGEGAGLSEAFHYTGSQNVASIEANGLRADAYATTTGELSPLQAQIDLALPPNRGLPGGLIRIDLAGLRAAGYEIPEVGQVGRSFNMPGGGYELQFPYSIPSEFLKVIR